MSNKDYYADERELRSENMKHSYSPSQNSTRSSEDGTAGCQDNIPKARNIEKNVEKRDK